METYNDDIMEAVRQSLGLEEDDISADDKIMGMDRVEVFKRYCRWNGLLGSWHDTLLEVVENIYNVKLEEVNMSRTNKTISNLQKVWDKLDAAYENMESVFEILESMIGLPNNLLNEMERFDISEISSLKQCIEQLIEDKERE